MPQQIPIFDLIVNASLPVQIVMALLAAASVISWMMIFQRWFALGRAHRQMDEFEDHFWSGVDLRELYGELQEDADNLNGSEMIFAAGFREYIRLSEQPGVDPDAIMQGVERAMRVARVREEEFLERHLGFLATVGSTAVYVGLLGTVWGIMNSFRSLANMSQATLASVAPGISEALIATAMGLVAAIPAMVGYNRFSARVDVLVKRYDTFAEELTSILYRASHKT
ncbi:MAG: protein TolQ [Gammaproteobacteria bacterium]|nr:protein TolQ [Gammaproteobacteria bacterium]